MSGDGDELRVPPAGGPLRGEPPLPGDKSISHRALILAGLAQGRARVEGLLDSADLAATRRCMQALGLRVEAPAPGVVQVHGAAGPGSGAGQRGGALREPDDVLDCGNSGTTMRLLCGLLAGQPLHAVLTGDASLRRRPMGRVVQPLRALGAQLDGREGGRLAPLSVRGRRPLPGGRVESTVASAQVKSALLLAAAQAQGEVAVVVPAGSRDHTERMLRAMGARLSQRSLADGREELRLAPGPLQLVDLRVPADPSSAAFLVVAALLVPGSALTLRGVGLNPTRTGLFDVLRRMGAPLQVEVEGQAGGEPVGTVAVHSGPLRGVEVGGAELVRLIDEVPALAVAAAFAHGETRITDASELRVKESDRVRATVALLRALGAPADELDDGLCVQGSAGAPLPGGVVDAHADHRLAMAGIVAGLACAGGSTVRGASAVAVSWPGFLPTLRALLAPASTVPTPAPPPDGAPRA